jgi:formylglycine-generating enzyme required for sulfatase activity
MNKHISIPELGFQMEFIYVRPGTFMMGSPETETNRRNDETFHEVTISKPFYLGKYPVTQKQYAALTGDNPSLFEGENLPVERVCIRDL